MGGGNYALPVSCSFYFGCADSVEFGAESAMRIRRDYAGGPPGAARIRARQAPYRRLGISSSSPFRPQLDGQPVARPRRRRLEQLMPALRCRPRQGRLEPRASALFRLPALAPVHGSVTEHHVDLPFATSSARFAIPCLGVIRGESSVSSHGSRGCLDSDDSAFCRPSDRYPVSGLGHSHGYRVCSDELLLDPPGDFSHVLSAYRRGRWGRWPGGGCHSRRCGWPAVLLAAPDCSQCHAQGDGFLPVVFFLHGLLSIAGSASDSPAPTPLAWASRLRLEPKETPSSLMTADTTTATR